MTICIAAPCVYKGEPRIVVAADRMIAGDDASGEIEFKFEELLPASLLAMYSGRQSQALDLIYSYRLGLKDVAVTAEELPAELYRILMERQQTIIDRVVGIRLGGMSLEQFVGAGGRLDDGIGAELIAAVHAARIAVDLIVAGFLPDIMRGNVHPTITKVNETGVETFKNFLCIGVGQVPAEQVLYRREQSETLDLDLTIYNLFEAKKMAEIVPGVGTETTMAVMKPATDGDASYFSFKGVKPETLTWLLQRYLEHRPKPMYSLTIPAELRSWDD